MRRRLAADYCLIIGLAFSCLVGSTQEERSVAVGIVIRKRSLKVVQVVERSEGDLGLVGRS